MAIATMRVIRRITQDDTAKTPITGSISPIAFRDIDESIAWTGGTHIYQGYWLFLVPTGLNSGIKWAVQTAAGVFTEDPILNGGAFSDATDLGPLISALVEIEEG